MSGADIDHVVFACNEAFAPHCAAALHSLLAHHPQRRITVHVLHSGLQDATKRALAEVVSGHRHELHLKHVTPESLSELGSVAEERFTLNAYHRLLAPALVDANRALYLDSDLVVLGPLDELFELPLGETPLAAVPDASVNRWRELGMTEGSPYLNSGVLIMNLRVWRALRLTEQIWEFAVSQPQVIKFADQCAINAVLDGNWIPLEARWNRQIALAPQRWFGGPDPAWPNTRIVHFAGNSKPWLIAEHPPWKSDYLRHRKATPFSYRWSEDLGLKSVARWFWRLWLHAYRAIPRAS